MLARTGLIYQPVAEHPKFPLGMIQHQLTGGGFDPATMRSFWPDGSVYQNVGALMDVYDFGVHPKEIDARFASMTSFLFAWRSVFGYDAAWRAWCSIFDAAFSDIHITVDPKEPVAALKTVPRGEYDEGWDYDYPAYGLLTQRVLKMSVNDAKAMKMLTAAHVAQGNRYMKQLVGGLIDLQYKNPKLGTAFTLQGSFGEAYLHQQPGLYAVDAENVTVDGRIDNGWAWGESMKRALKEHWGQEPDFPVDGQTKADLARMAPIHEFGSTTPPREFAHTGIDLIAAEGTAIKAIYDGVVVKIVDNWKEGGARAGNHVIVRHDATIDGKKRKATSEYYHLKGVSDDIEVGQEVKKGDVVGFLGKTGTKKPHLHFVMTYSDALDGYGRSVKKEIIDPETVLEEGLIMAMARKGYSFGEAAIPSLAVGGVMLQAIAANEIMFDRAVSGDFAEMLPAVVAPVAQVASSVASTVNQAASQATELGGAVLTKGFDVFGPGKPARAMLIGMYEYTFPGTNAGQWAASALDALNRGHQANMSGGDVSAIVAAALGNAELTDEQKGQAVQLAINAYQSYANSQE